MNIKKYILPVITLLLAGCDTIYEYPDSPLLPELDVTLNIRLDPDLEFDFEQEITTRSLTPGEPLENHKVRLIVEAYADNYPGTNLVAPEVYDTKPEARSETIFDNIGEIEEIVSLQLKLSAKPYFLLIWADYISSDQYTGGYYNTSKLHSVRFIEPYTSNTRGRDAFVCCKRINLSEYKGSVHLPEEFPLWRPLAKYELITTDIGKYVEQLRSKSAKRPDFENYTVKVSYRGYFPTGFDAITDRPDDAQTGMEYEARLTQITETSAVIALDYVLTNGGDSFVVADIRIYDKDGALVNESNGIQIPYRRNVITRVRGNFLTKSYGSGVTINPDFDGEFNIYL